MYPNMRENKTGSPAFKRIASHGLFRNVGSHFHHVRKSLITAFGLGGLALQNIRTCETEMCQCANGFVEHQFRDGRELLELGTGPAP